MVSSRFVRDYYYDDPLYKKAFWGTVKTLNAAKEVAIAGYAGYLVYQHWPEIVETAAKLLEG